MSTLQRITLQQALDSGAAALLIYCSAGRAHYGGCFHSGRIELWLALRRWSKHRRLDDLPLRCSRCGAASPDVRPDFRHASDPADAGQQEFLDRWRSRRNDR